MRRLLPFLAAALLGAAVPTPAGAPPPPSSETLPADAGVPRYAHVVVIVEENKSFERIVGSPDAPRLTALARTYGSATAMYGEVHPSEGNYVAMIGGGTFGIHDDAGWSTPGHALGARSLPQQLVDARLDWRGYFGSIPQSGSTETFSPGDATHPAGLYASKHNPFVNFEAVRTKADFAQHTVALERFVDDVDGDALPAFSLVVPNQCDEMHGLRAGDPNVPADCSGAAVVRRGDRIAADLVARVLHSGMWPSRENNAVVVTWDEDDGSTSGAQGCCGSQPGSVAEFGGGHIPTIVITNHGPRGVADPTPYNHYSLLRTLEDAFGLREYLGYAGATSRGVAPMTPLFAVKPLRAPG